MERKRILIADDEPQIAEALAKYFRREGMIVETSGTVADTLRALESFAPDILVLDVMLPDGSGSDVLRTTAKPDGRAPTICLRREWTKPIASSDHNSAQTIT